MNISDIYTEISLKYKDRNFNKIDKPIISILMPCYNVEKFLKASLDSILEQSFQDYEIVCVDDGSTDNTLHILKAYSQIDSRIRIFSQKNQGPSAALNNCIDNAQGEFITFIDSDDIVNETYLENLYNALINNNCDIALANVIRTRKLYQKDRIRYTEEKVYTSLQDKITACNIPECCYAPGKLYKAELIKNSYFKVGVYYEDVIWLPEIIKKAKSVVTVPDSSYYYIANYSSIVKQQQSPQKQMNNYEAKKYIVNFFKNNDLVLAEKEKNITKKIIYLGKTPFLKLKDKNFVNTWLLFGFLPIFKYRDFDSHYIFKFLGIRIAKRHKTIFPYSEAKEYGITTEKRNPQLIVSLTSFPARIKYVHIAINTILQQNLKPDRLILWLAESQFENKEKDLPQELLKLKELGLEIRWCEDLRSYKKLVPALREFPEDIIVTADDDIYYPENWLKSLYEAYLKNPKNIYVKRAVRMKAENNKICDMYKRDEAFTRNFKDASFSNQFMGGSGCLFPPHSLHDDVFDVNKFLLLVPTHDDIYFWVMAVLNGTKIEVVGGFDEEILNIDNSQDVGICKINNEYGNGLSSEKAFEKICNNYSQIIDILKEEQNA